MRFLVTILSLTIICTATIAVAIDGAEARERGTSTTQQLIELRNRLHTYQTYVKQQNESAKETATPQTTKTTTVAQTPTDTEVHNASDTYLVAVRTEIHELTNLERKRAGLTELAYDSRLSRVAESHSEDMLTRDYFSHTRRQ